MENSENSCSAKMLQHATKICIHILRWGIFFNWTLETASGNDMDNIKCSHGYTQHSTAQDTTQQGSAEQSCSGQLATLFGVRPFSRLQRVQYKYKSTKCTTNTSRMACQTRQGSHRCINCLIVCRDRDVIMSIKLLPELWPDRQLDMDLASISGCSLVWFVWLVSSVLDGHPWDR